MIPARQPGLSRGGRGLRAVAVAATGVVAAGLLVGAGASADSTFSVRMAAGATSSYTDPSGRVWTADKGYSGSSVFRGGGEISGTTADPVYRRHRWGMTGYTIPVDCAGTFKVSLHFAETVISRKGGRVFNVSAEGVQKISKLDVFAAAGEYKALTRTFDVAVKDGKLNLGFKAVVEDPMVSGIEVKRSTACAGKPAPTTAAPTTAAPTTAAPTTAAPTTAAPTTAAPTTAAPTTAAPTTAAPTTKAPTTPTTGFAKRINVASTSSYSESNGTVWAADSGADGGSTYQAGNVAVANTTSDGLYQKHRWGMSGYDVSVPSKATYRVSLLFTESVFNSSGSRIFDVTAEGATKLDNLDVFAEAGGLNRALTRTFDVSVTDGVLDLGFSASKDDPMVSAIQVASVSGSTSTPAPTTSSTPTPTPTVSSTPKPTATATATATPPPTVTPTQTTAPSGGFPNASNTGVPAGTQLTSSGSITVTQDGAVISNKLVNGDITVLANNVTIKNSKIVGGRIAAGYGSEQSGLVITDVELDGQGRLPGQSAIGDANYQCIRCNIHGTGNGPRAGANVLVQDSYIHDLCCYSAGDHRTGFGSNGGSNITIKHNYIECDISGCSAAASFYNQWTTNNVLIENNKFNTQGNYCLYAGSDGVTNFRVINNVFGQEFNAQCGASGAVASRGAGSTWSGNKMEDGRAVN